MRYQPPGKDSDTWEAAMLREDFPAAWAIADAVLAARDPSTRDDPALPYHERWVWDGRDLTGQQVVVRCYHGLGDTLQFARFLPALRRRAAHVTLEVQAELYPVLAAMPGVDTTVPFNPCAPLAATADIEIMELQHALRQPPGATPYLSIPPRPVPGAHCGVCWQAGNWDPDRSIPLDQLRSALPLNAISLQRGATGLPDPLGGNMDIPATAGLVASLDCIVSVDTMVVHLAGALGRPIHLLLKADADWRWGTGDRTAWYSSVRIHRQASPGDWTGALQSLHAAITAGC